MPDLVATSEVANFLGGVPVDSALRGLVDQVEGFFNASCGRRDRPFQPASPARVEVHDGTGRSTLFLHYPASRVTAFAIGLDPDDPTYSINVTDSGVTEASTGNRRVLRLNGSPVLVYEVGHRRIDRMDGVFGTLGRPREVTVTYDTADDLPIDANLAICRGVAAIYWQRGSEDASSQTVGGHTQLTKALEGDPVWERAVAMNSVVA